MFISSFAAASSTTIPTGTDVVVIGDRGQGTYVSDSGYDPTAHPQAGFVSANSRKFRLAEEVVTPFMFGAVDATGQIKEDSETVTDCIGALDAMWAWVEARGETTGAGQLITMDLSSARGLGISRTWQLVTDADGAWWNGVIFKIIPGRLVAMAEMDELVLLQGKSFHCTGTWELWGGADAQIDYGYASCYAKNGMRVKGAAGSILGNIDAQGFRRFALQLDKTNDPATNNNIPIKVGEIKAIQCGSVGGASTAGAEQGYGGSYSSGQWESAPAYNGSHLQTHLMTLTPASGVKPTDLQVGDPLRFNSLSSEGMITEIVSTTSTTATVRVFPWQTVEASGTFVSMHGGAFSDWGGDTACTSVDLVYLLGGATGLQLQSLYAPKIGRLLVESAELGVQIGAQLLSSMEGCDVGQLHLENVNYTFLEFFVAAQGFHFGAPSNIQGTARGKFGKAKRVVPSYATGGGGTFQGYNKQSIRGVTFELDGGSVSCGFGGITDKAGVGNPSIGNAPALARTGPMNVNSSTLSLFVDKSLADVVQFSRTAEFGPIYGSGTDGTPTGTVSLAIDSSQTGVTVNGGAGPFTIPSGTGAIMGRAVYEPPATGDNGNWRIAHWRVTM